MRLCAAQECDRLEHTNPMEVGDGLIAGFCCCKCQGRTFMQEWAFMGKKHYSHCQNRYPVAGPPPERAPVIDASVATQPSSTPPLDSSSLNVHTQVIQVVDRPAGSDPFSDGVAAGWLQRREGDFFCILCSKWCTPEHLRKEAHLRKVEWHAREHTIPQAPEPPQEPQPVTSQQQGTDPPPPPMPPQGTQLWQRQRQGETVTPPPPPPPTPPVMPPPSLSLPVSVPAVYMLGVEAGWLEMREGEPYCKACSKWASGNHLETTRHQNAVQYMEVQLSQRPQQNAEGWKIFIDGEEFCDLCNKWATADHMNTRKHQELVEQWRAREVVPQQPVEPFLQLRDCSGGWNVMERFCLLCNKWADQGHLESSVHLRQVQENLVGGVGVAMEPVEQCTATLVGNDEPNKVVARRVVRRRAKVTDVGENGALTLELEADSRIVHISPKLFEDWPLKPRLADVLTLGNPKATPTLCEAGALTVQQRGILCEGLLRACDTRGTAEACGASLSMYRPFLVSVLSMACDGSEDAGVLHSTQLLKIMKEAASVDTRGSSPQRAFLEVCASSSFLRESVPRLVQRQQLDGALCAEVVERIITSIPTTVCFLQPLLFASLAAAPAQSSQRMRRVVEAISDALAQYSGNLEAVSWKRASSTPKLFRTGFAHLPEARDRYASADELHETMYLLLRANCCLSFERRIEEFAQGHLKSGDMRVYYVHLQSLVLMSRCSGLAATALCSQFPGSARPGAKSLVFGNLVAISTSGAPFRQVLWGTVLETTQRGQLLEVVLQFPEELNDMCTSFSVVERLVQTVGRRLVLVESPVYFQAYRAPLWCLQHREMAQVLEPILTAQEDERPNSKTVPWAEAATEYLDKVLGQAYTFDDSQRRALLAALTKPVAVIQGPPGTGKTFVGQRFVEVLINISRRSGRSSTDEGSDTDGDVSEEDVLYGNVPVPILLLCLKNHALDEFVRSALKTTKNVIRVGGRGAEDLMHCNLREVARERKKHRTLARTQYNLIQEKTEVEELLAEEFQAWAVKTRPAELLLSHASDEQLLSLTRCCTGTHADAGRLHQFVENSVTHSMRKEVGASDIEACLEEWLSRAGDLAEVPLHLDVPSVVPDVCSSDDEEAVEKTEERRALAEHTYGRISLPLPSWRAVGSLPTGEMDVEDLYESDLHLLPPRNRALLVRHWLSIEVDAFRNKFEGLFSHHQVLAQRISDLDLQHRADVLRGAEIVCCTITGASIQSELLAKVGFRVLLVEEAAEIMQPLLLAAAPSSILHFVQIGDHQQLRPIVENEELNAVHLDVSMMERFVNLGEQHCTFVQLTRQARMRPEFVELIRDIYPNLTTATERLEVDRMTGLRTREVPALLRCSMFFKDTSAHQSSSADGGKSTINKGEAGEICQLCQLLICEGHKQEQITVLAMYKAQRSLLRQQLSALHLQNITTSTVDQYQGDENDIVLVSITRSDHATAFINSQNRRCVASSRARCCVIFFGNLPMLRKSKAWMHILHTLKENSGSDLPLVCPRHPDAGRLILGTPCPHNCMEELPCGHRCGKSCHPPGKHPLCDLLINDRFVECGHEINRFCGTPLADLKCSVPVTVRQSCGHSEDRPCHSSKRPCTVLVGIVCQHCGEEGQLECWRKETEAYTFSCPKPCARNMRCGHPCKLRCGENCDLGLDSCSVCETERQYWSEQRRKEIQDQCDAINPEDFRLIEWMTASIRFGEVQRQTAASMDEHQLHYRVMRVAEVVNPQLRRKYLFASQKCAHVSDPVTRFVLVQSMAEADEIAKEGFTSARFEPHFDVPMSPEHSDVHAELVYLLCDVQMGREHRGELSQSSKKSLPKGFDTHFDASSMVHRLKPSLVLPRYIVTVKVETKNDRMPFPAHWSSGDRALQRGVALVPLALNCTEIKVLRSMLSTDPRHLGKGRDVKEKDVYSKLVLARGWRIENPRLWQRYSVERQGVQEELEQHQLRLPNMQWRQSFFEASTELPENLVHKVNEVRLWHGTKPDTVLALLRNGLNERFSGGCFGHGSYLAEDAGKNDQYVVKDPALGSPKLGELHRLLYKDVDHPGNVFYLLLCRTVLGVCVRTQSGDGLATSMDDSSSQVFATSERRELALIPGSTCHYHGLLVELGDAVKRFREILQFHDSRIYPEYLVAYHRI